MKLRLSNHSLGLIALLLGLLLTGLLPASLSAQFKIERRAGDARDDPRLEFLRETLKATTHNTAKLELGSEGAKKKVEVASGKAKTDSADFQQIALLESGQLLALNESPAIKLRVETALQFGETQVATGNLSPGYPGLYSLWLGKGDDGSWLLRVNNEPDVWGSMHDAKADVSDIRLEHSIEEETEVPELTPVLERDADSDSGRLELRWGHHRWATSFVVR